MDDEESTRKGHNMISGKEAGEEGGGACDAYPHECELGQRGVSDVRYRPTPLRVLFKGSRQTTSEKTDEQVKRVRARIHIFTREKNT